MNPQQAENLRTLIRHMETTCAHELWMEEFFHAPSVAGGCGTPACALGEATTIEALRAQGMHDWKACFAELHESGSVFGLSRKDTFRLFGNSYDNAWRSNNVTPKEWAIEARMVLAERRYSMDTEPKPEPFKAFMARALEPVAVEA